MLIIIERFDILRIQPHHRRCQCATQRIFTLRRHHRLQYPQQFLRFEGFKDAVTVGKIDRRDRQLRQRIADERRLLATAHQHADIRRAHRS
ncbi:hypothetical protein D3C81_1569040 [compost metagenome]